MQVSELQIVDTFNFGIHVRLEFACHLIYMHRAVKPVESPDDEEHRLR